ncbi:uncharacterized protein LOC128110428 [Peromyscus californicus insignis]|uniref:uncharacterized protein LOC128110428 n=1 Tax=Peromyscus californicus insignis TaxID=564181 RepID=UPI0022A6B71B|nr:uncharacterized protein LOC128110428 [Peromyscus californicus insignis]
MTMKRLLAIMITVMLMFPGTIQRETKLWAVLKTWPYPLPLTSDSGILPFIFTTNDTLEWPSLPFDDVKAIDNFTWVSLYNTLCFSMSQKNISENPCLVLHHHVLGVFHHVVNRSTTSVGRGTAILLQGVTPRAISKGGASPPRQPSLLPRCMSSVTWPPAWTGCQSTLQPNFVNLNRTFSLSLKVSPYNNSFSGFNFSYNNPLQAAFSNPFDSWVLCNSRSACTQLNALGFVKGGAFQNCSYSVHMGMTFESDVTLNCTHSKSVHFSPTLVCVWPPFLFLLFNYSGGMLNCSSQKCFLAQCWNASEHDSAIVMRVPTYIPVPVRIDDAQLPVVLSRQKRDFGITAAIVTAIALSDTAAGLAAASMATSVPTAQALNELSSNTAKALQSQNAINVHLHRGITLLNQRVDLLQEQIDIMEGVLTSACIAPMTGLCITSITYENWTRAANLSKQLSAMITGAWTAEFDNLTATLRNEIVAVNSTRVHVATAEELLTWIHQSFNFLKEWAGLGALLVLVILAFLVCLWCFHKMRFAQRCQAAMIIQAFTAIEAGQSPQAWLVKLQS